MLVLLILSRSLKDFKDLYKKKTEKQTKWENWKDMLLMYWQHGPKHCLSHGVCYDHGGAIGPWEELWQQGCGYGPVGGAMCLLLQGVAVSLFTAHPQSLTVLSGLLVWWWWCLRIHHTCCDHLAQQPIRGETIWLSSQSEERPSGSVANPSRAPSHLLLWAMMVQNFHLCVKLC